jgi:hypothetical protein
VNVLGPVGNYNGFRWEPEHVEIEVFSPFRELLHVLDGYIKGFA